MSKLSIDIETFIEVTDDGRLTTEVYFGDTNNPVSGESFTIMDIIEKTVEYYEMPNGGYSHTEDLSMILEELRTDIMNSLNYINMVLYQVDKDTNSDTNNTNNTISRVADELLEQLSRADVVTNNTNSTNTDSDQLDLFDHPVPTDVLFRSIYYTNTEQ